MTTTDPRLYGGWRQAHGIEILGRPALHVFTCLGLLLLTAVTVMKSLPAGGVVAVLTVGTCAALLVRWDQMSLAAYVTRKAHWSAARRAGWTLFRADTGEGRWRLPGPMVTTRLLVADPGTAHERAVVYDDHGRTLTASVLVDPTATVLVDTSEVDAWVASWHAWLARLGSQPTVKWAAVTVDSAPTPGTSLADYVTGTASPGAPQVACDVMAELVERGPGSSADVETRVTVTVDPWAAPTCSPDVAEQVRAFTRTLSGLETGLASCGVRVDRWATARDLCGIVRTAFDPAARGECLRLRRADPDEALTWATAGPSGAAEAWGYYRHDSGVSVSWEWQEAPRQQVTADVLAALLAPGRWQRRVTLIYTATPAHTTADHLQRQVDAANVKADIRAKAGWTSRARDAVDTQHAHRAALEEAAAGAGVVSVALYVTTTVIDEKDLPAAITDTEHAARSSKVRLRRLYGAQAAGFAATLPLGIHPSDLSRKAAQ